MRDVTAKQTLLRQWRFSHVETFLCPTEDTSRGYACMVLRSERALLWICRMIWLFLVRLLYDQVECRLMFYLSCNWQNVRVLYTRTGTYSHTSFNRVELATSSSVQHLQAACGLARPGRQEAERRSQSITYDLQVQWRKPQAIGM